MNIPSNSLILDIITMIPYVNCAVFIEVHHNVVESDSQSFLDLILDISENRGIFIFHVDCLSTVF